MLSRFGFGRRRSSEQPLPLAMYAPALRRALIALVDGPTPLTVNDENDKEVLAAYLRESSLRWDRLRVICTELDSMKPDDVRLDAVHRSIRQAALGTLSVLNCTNAMLVANFKGDAQEETLWWERMAKELSPLGVAASYLGSHLRLIRTDHPDLFLKLEIPDRVMNSMEPGKPLTWVSWRSD